MSSSPAVLPPPSRRPVCRGRCGARHRRARGTGGPASRRTRPRAPRPTRSATPAAHRVAQTRGPARRPRHGRRSARFGWARWLARGFPRRTNPQPVRPRERAAPHRQRRHAAGCDVDAQFHAPAPFEHLVVVDIAGARNNPFGEAEADRQVLQMRRGGEHHRMGDPLVDEGDRRLFDDRFLPRRPRAEATPRNGRTTRQPPSRPPGGAPTRALASSASSIMSPPTSAASAPGPTSTPAPCSADCIRGSNPQHNRQPRGMSEGVTRSPRNSRTMPSSTAVRAGTDPPSASPSRSTSSGFPSSTMRVPWMPRKRSSRL